MPESEAKKCGIDIPAEEDKQSAASDALTINGVTVRVVFARENNAEIAKSVRETLKESYNRRLEDGNIGHQGA